METVRFSVLLQEGCLSGLLEPNRPVRPSRRFYDLGSPTLPDLLRGSGADIWTATNAWRSFVASIRDGTHVDRESVVLEGVDAFFEHRDQCGPLAEEFDRIADRAGASVESTVAVAVLGLMHEYLVTGRKGSYLDVFHRIDARLPAVQEVTTFREVVLTQLPKNR